MDGLDEVRTMEISLTQIWKDHKARGLKSQGELTLKITIDKNGWHKT